MGYYNTSCLCALHVYCAHVCAVLSLSLWPFEQTDGDTPLLAASWEGHVEVVRTLLNAEAAVNQADVGSCLWGMCHDSHLPELWRAIIGFGFGLLASVCSRPVLVSHRFGYVACSHPSSQSFIHPALLCVRALP